jgi:Lon protease-like protein
MPADSVSAPDLDGLAVERRNVTRLIRVVSVFVAWPSLTIAFAFLVFTGPSDHWQHIFGLLPLGVAACVAFALAPRLAARWVQDG